jgi:hypothetical protein
MLLRPLALTAAATLALAACVTVTEVPARLSSVKLVPESGLATDYCKRRTQGTTNVVDVTFANTGTADYEGGDPVSVQFERAVSRGTIPAIAKGKSVTLAFPLPASCFDPNCDFVITYSNQPPVSATCLG